MSRSLFPRLFVAACLALPALSAPALAEETAAAAPADASAVVAGIEAAYKDVQSLKASFTQVSRSVAMGEGPAQSGTVAMARPRKMRWEFSAPAKSLFVTDGSTMWVYTPADNQVIISEDLGGGGSGDGMDQLLQSLDSLGQHFDVTALDAPAGSAALSLAPKKENVQFKRLELTVDAKDYMLQKLVVTDAFDGQTVLTFSGVEKNPTIEDGAFVFQVPDGANVVRSDGI